MRLTKFQPKHLLEFEWLNSSEIQDPKQLLLFGCEYKGTNAFSVEDEDGVILGCGGVKMLSTTVGEAWVTPSNVLRKRDILMLCKRVLDVIFNQTPNLNRIQASIIDGFKGAESLARHLGFVYEGTMRKFGRNGEDYKLFALVR